MMRLGRPPSRVITPLAALMLLLAPSADARPLPLWEVGLGVGALSLPVYPGSAERSAYVLPFPWLVYRGERLRVDRQGARGVLVETPRFRFDISGDATAPVDSDDDSARAGMEDLDALLEIGPSAEWRLLDRPGVRVDLRLPVRAAIATDLDSFRHVGWTASPGLSLDMPAALGRWSLGLRAALQFGSRDYHGYYYDVTSADATDTRPLFNADSGYSGAVLQLSTSRRYGSTWVGAFMRHESFSGAAWADSPLLRDESNWSAGVGVGWILWQSASPGASDAPPGGMVGSRHGTGNGETRSASAVYGGGH